MPEDVARLLDEGNLRAAFDARPPYQRNDYLGWIDRAREPATRQKRLDQMLDELAGGKLYMNMQWRQRRPHTEVSSE
jgi:uncharacterized protein YdeI (YjbR/CyaY-like superfamily)